MSDLFLNVVETSLAGAVIAAILLVGRSLFRGKIAPSWRYALWLLLSVRLLWPAHLESPLRFDVAPTPIESIRTVPLEASASAKPGPHGPIVTTDHERPWLAIAAVVWIAGIACLGLYHAGMHLRFALRVRRSEIVPSDSLIHAFEKAKRTVGAGASVRLVVSGAVDGPVLTGIWRPKLIVPATEPDKRTASEWRHVFVHELVHARRNDIAVNAIAFAALMLHWFNPLLWIAYKSMREDQELSCDARAIALLGPAERAPYGLTLLALAEQGRASSRGGLPATAHFLRKRGSLLRKRIELLRDGASPSRLWPAVVCLTAVLAGCTTLPDANSDPEQVAAAYYQALSRVDYEKAYTLHDHQFDDGGIPKEEWIKRMGVIYGIRRPDERIQLAYQVGEPSPPSEDGTVAVLVEVDYVKYFRNGSKHLIDAVEEVRLREREGKWYVDRISWKSMEDKFYEENYK